MADSKISDLAAATTPLVGTELAVIVQTGVTKQVAVSDLASSGDNLYTADGTLSATRTVTMGGFDLDLTGGTTNVRAEATGTNIPFRVGTGDINDNLLFSVTDFNATSQPFGSININTQIKGNTNNRTLDVGAYGLGDTLGYPSASAWRNDEGAGDSAEGSLLISKAGTFAIMQFTTEQLIVDGSGDVTINNAGTSLGAKLGVKAGGALSTDIALNVRNSVDTKDIFSVLGDGSVFSKGRGGKASNTGFGEEVFKTTTTGINNTGVGFNSLTSLTTGIKNVGLGSYALNGINTGDNNVAIGHTTLFSVSAGGGNVAVGSAAGRYISGGVTNNTTCSTSIFIGQEAFPLANSQTNQIVIGDSTVGNGSNTTTIGNSSTVSTHLQGVVVVGEYTVATLPTASTYQAGMIMVSDETGGYTQAFSDGTNWRRVQDRAIVS